jgi:hypothetical protein
MGRWINKILLFIAVLTVVGHNTLPHIHHDIIDAIAFHNHHDGEESNDHDHHEQKKENNHSIFSFAQLDDEFVPKQYNKICIDLPALYLLVPIITDKFEAVKEISKNYFGYYREFPPPGKYLFNRFSRPPPSC